MTAAATYRDVLARLVVARRFGMKLGLERMRGLLDSLGAAAHRRPPDRRLGEVIHVAGTNGKGSTVAMLAALAASKGARVATYTSPHLSTLRERIVIDGAMVSEEQVVEAAARVDAAGGSELTFFEQVTAIAMDLIADANVDVTILEVGLGGRLDATNVIAPDVLGCACVTGVAMDHEVHLGDTLDAIAFEKAGICKPGRPVVIGRAGEDVGAAFLAKHAALAGADPIILVEESAAVRVPAISLAGAHQRRNAATAIAVMEQLGRAYDPGALTRVRHPGRFEEAGEWILDGAHNPHGARALAATLRERGIEPVLVLAVSADKDVRAIADALVPCVRAVVATKYQQERAMDPEALAGVLREAGAVRVHTAGDLRAAVELAHGLGSPVLIAGSLFLVGEARTMLLGAPADPLVATELVANVTGA